jgi:Arc/MetJ-type ribon-helix-helix transcriptional regulator
VEAAYGSASDVVQAAVAALEAERWEDVLPLVRPDAVKALRETRVRWMEESEMRSARTPEQVQAEQPWLPREVAAYYAEQDQQYATAGMPMPGAEWGVSSASELRALSPDQFFVRFLSAASPAARLRAAIAVSAKPPKDLAGALASAAALNQRRWVVLGEVAEGTRRAHVLFRELAAKAQYDAEAPAGEVRVTTLDHVEGRWWLRIDHTLLESPPTYSFVWAPEEDASTEA